MIETAIRLNEELLARLERLASYRQTNRDALLSEAILSYLLQEEPHVVHAESLAPLSSDDIDAINEGIADLEAGRTMPFADYVKEREAARAARRAQRGSITA